MDIKKSNLYLAIMAIAMTLIACSMDSFASFWVKYAHLVAFTAVFIYGMYKVDKSKEEEDE